VLQAAEMAGRSGSALEILVLLALAWQVQGETARALGALERVLTLAEPEGYVRLLVDEGAPMADLLQQAARRSLSSAYGLRLLAALDRAPSSHSAAQPLAEPLTVRELEVLRLLAAGLSSREIAAELVVSLSTAKAHARHIFGKLEVHNRTQAAVRARELHLL
jgi:LuxR family maltose regulon positive regulatory protein